MTHKIKYNVNFKNSQQIREINKFGDVRRLGMGLKMQIVKKYFYWWKANLTLGLLTAN